MFLLLQVLIFIILPIPILLFASRVYFQTQKRKQRALKNKNHGLIVGFFHPYSNAGGGGERVLWCLINVVQKLWPNSHCLIYTGDHIPAEKQIERAQKQFNVQLTKPVEFVFLEKRHLVEASRYPRFTLLGQSLGSMVLGYEALSKVTPDLFIDSMGYSFTFPIAKLLFGCKVAAYVHYPTISTDMLKRVSERSSAHNNRSDIANSNLKSFAKLLYYRAFSWIYGFTGAFSDCVMANSTWTCGHVQDIWFLGKSNKAQIVYPPCAVSEFLALNPLDPSSSSSSSSSSSLFMNREKIVLSIGQFRPEKDHPLQLRSFAKFLETNPKFKAPIDSGYNKNPGDENSMSDFDNRYPVLCLLGSCRDAGDESRVKHLRNLAYDLGIHSQVKFQVNADFATLKNLLSRSLIGIHTMWNEHFGIGVVEFMASGVLALAHGTAGPKMDIVVPLGESRPTGFLATNCEEYAEKIGFILDSYERRDRELIQVQANGRIQSDKFSEQSFAKSAERCLAKIRV